MLVKLSTHVLDVSRGAPAAGVLVHLYELFDVRKKIFSCITNSDGRTDTPLLSGSQLPTGVYEIVFEVGQYFSDIKPYVSTIPFLDEIPVRFGIFNEMQNYHVPLLVSPFGYSTYRGS